MIVPYLLTVLIVGSGAVAFYVAKYRRIPQSTYVPAAAWTRATIYLSLCNVLATLAGTIDVVLAQPVATAIQLADPGWWAFCVACFGYIFVAYWILWARMTLTFDRRHYLGAEIALGIAWGWSVGLALLTFFHLWNQAGLPAWAVYLGSYACMGTWQYFVHDYFWDVYVSPEHDSPRSLVSKTILSHIPNVALCLLFLLIYNNYLLYVLSQCFALTAAAIFQRFPAPWAKEPIHAPRTRRGIFGLLRGAGYTEKDTALPPPRSE